MADQHSFIRNGWKTWIEYDRPELHDRVGYRDWLMAYEIPSPGRPFAEDALISAVERGLRDFQAYWPGNAKLRKYVRERITLALRSKDLSLSRVVYLMTTWGCEPSLAKNWLLQGPQGIDWCAKACIWLLMAAFPLRSSDPCYHGELDEQILNEGLHHNEWQNQCKRVEVQQQNRVRIALLPPTKSWEIRSWRMMALWRAQKLEWSGTRSSSNGLLMGSFKDAAAKITMLEFGLDADSGDSDAILLQQLLVIDPAHWQEFMEMNVRGELTIYHLLNDRPREICYLPAQILVPHVKQYRQALEGADRDGALSGLIKHMRQFHHCGNICFTKPGEVEAILMTFHETGAPRHPDCADIDVHELEYDVSDCAPNCPRARSTGNTTWDLMLWEGCCAIAWR
ncbi:hypothetical protein PFICI_07756 [Pestalotiopsis fici W106-1]|uniref:Uncharacterized protein n=1 Tax=Pestalotiopsis fici (strain W106-1 / CGMCC3.15140) TaxID=1229662 RepID=W3X4D4_PESFW|nr:uncharacterized protein PFICI_07756 [Pestalotiopsis fici W106-1]ETS80227.1 hypothetical protein PFICI_07756 [Pestalotiopsis fici W106-1]